MTHDQANRDRWELRPGGGTTRPGPGRLTYGTGTAMSRPKGLRMMVYDVLDELGALKHKLECSGTSHALVLSPSEAQEACVAIENSIEELRRVASGLSSAGVAD